MMKKGMDLYDSLLEVINDGIAQALTRKKGQEISISPGKEISVTGDAPSYEKRTKGWHAINALLGKGYPADRPGEMRKTISSEDRALLVSLYGRKGTWDADESEIIRESGLGMAIDCFGSLFPRMDAVLDMIVQGMSGTVEQGDFIVDVIGGIKTTDDPLFGYVEVGEDGMTPLEDMTGERMSLQAVIGCLAGFWFPTSHGEVPSLNGMNLNWLDVSKVRSMKRLFFDKPFNGDISLWNVGSVTDMSYMFSESGFDGDISLWDVGNVKTMFSMFYKSGFSGNISGWRIPRGCDTSFMYGKCPIRKEFRAMKTKKRVNESSCNVISGNSSVLNEKHGVNKEAHELYIELKRRLNAGEYEIVDKEHDDLSSHVAMSMFTDDAEVKKIVLKFIWKGHEYPVTILYGKIPKS